MNSRAFSYSLQALSINASVSPMAEIAGLLIVLPPRICESGIEMVLAETIPVREIVCYLLHGRSLSCKADSWAADTRLHADVRERCRGRWR
jgi:hypothetical protein